MFSWLDITQILLMLGACYACFTWGKYEGVSAVIQLLLDKKIVTESQLEKLED